MGKRSGRWTEMRRGRGRAAVWLAALLLASCGAQEETAVSPGPEVATESTPVRGDWLVLWLLADPESLNPLTSNDAASNAVLNWIFPSLLTLDNETLEQRPVIAKSLPTVSGDKLTYTFELRDDVTFSDGKPVTAADVVFTVKAAKNPEVLAPHYRNYLNSIRDVVAVDDHTVRFDLRERYFRNDLVLGGISPLPRHHYDPEGLLEEISVAEIEDPSKLAPEMRDRVSRFAKQFNEDYHRNPMGAGAFVLRDPQTDIVTGEKIVLRRRDDFWAPDDPVHGDAWVNRIVLRVINDREAALVAFKGGDLDRVALTPLQHLKQTGTRRFAAHAKKKVHVSPGYTYIGWNEKRKIFQDARVRRALGYLVDKQGLIDEVLFGLGVPVESPIFIERPEYNTNLPAHVFDPEKAKALLAEAGWADTDGDGVLDKEIDGERVPLRFEIISNSGNDIRKAIGLTVIDEMKRAGVDATFREIDWSIMLGKIKKFDYDAVILGWAMSVTSPDLYQVWHSSQAVEGGSNHVFYKNPEIDALLEAYRVEFDPAKRKEMYDRVQEILYEDQPYTFLFMGNAISAWDRRFRGVTWYPSGQTDMSEWWVPAENRKYQD
jgi:peptide/nickel transport system substrate-binding protein